MPLFPLIHKGRGVRRTHPTCCNLAVSLVTSSLSCAETFLCEASDASRSSCCCTSWARLCSSCMSTWSRIFLDSCRHIKPVRLQAGLMSWHLRRKRHCEIILRAFKTKDVCFRATRAFTRKKHYTEHAHKTKASMSMSEHEDRKFGGNRSSRS